MTTYRPRLSEDDIWTLRLALAGAVDDNMTALRATLSMPSADNNRRRIREYGAMYARMRELQGQREQGETRTQAWNETADLLVMLLGERLKA